MVRISIERSRILVGALSLSHIAAASALVPVDLPLWAKIAMAVVIGASLLRSLRRHALLLTTRAILAIEVKDQQHAAIMWRNGEWQEARILGSTYVTPALTVVNLRVVGERMQHHVLLVSDNIAAESFRRLRVLLRWSRAAD